MPLDAARRQLFLPLQLLQQHGSGIEEVFSGKPTPGMRAAIGQLIGEAHKHLATAFDLLAHVPPQVRPVFLPLALVRRDLQRLARADADLLVPQPTSRLRMLWTLWRASRSREFGGYKTPSQWSSLRAEAKQSISPRKEEWIASLRSQ